MEWSYLNGAAHASQMIPESQGRCFLALSKVSIKLNLVAQGDSSAHEFGLMPFSVADRLCEREDIRCGSQWNEKHPIVIGQDQILPIHRPISHGGTLQRAIRTWIEPLRTGRDRSEADDRQPNRSDFSRVTMQAPDHDAFESSPVGFKDNKIAYAAFVEPSAVVDHQHIARSSPLQRLKENVDAAGVSSRDYTPRQAASWKNSMQERGGAPHWGLSANARIRQMGGSQCFKPPPNLFVIHACSFTPFRHASNPYPANEHSPPRHGQRPSATAGVACRSSRIALAKTHL